MSVLTDQVEAQGEKIRDLESSLEEHRQKLASTEEMLQQVAHVYTHTCDKTSKKSISLFINILTTQKKEKEISDGRHISNH